MVFAKNKPDADSMVGALALGKIPKASQLPAPAPDVSTNAPKDFGKFLDEDKPEKLLGSKKAEIVRPKENSVNEQEKIKISIASLPKNQTNTKLSVSAKYPAAAAKAPAVIRKQESENPSKYSDIKPAFSDSLFDTKSVVQKTLDKVRD